MDEEVIIGFMDESSPQTTANTQRLWSFGKPVIYKNTDKIKANAFGCYMLNGTSVIDCIRQFEFDPSRQSDFDPPLSG